MSIDTLTIIALATQIVGVVVQIVGVSYTIYSNEKKQACLRRPNLGIPTHELRLLVKPTPLQELVYYQIEDVAASSVFFILVYSFTNLLYIR